MFSFHFRKTCAWDYQRRRLRPWPTSPLRCIWATITVLLGHRSIRCGPRLRHVGHDYGETKNAAHIRTESRPTSNGITGPHRPEYAYSSADGDHGYVVAKAEWTPDARYFVFSLESSGGHSVMNTPTQFLSLRDRGLCSLDSYVGEAGIEFADFRLSSPNTVEVEVNGIGTPVKVSLSFLATKAPNKEHGCVPCSSGTGHEFGDKTPYEHSPN